MQSLVVWTMPGVHPAINSDDPMFSDEPIRCKTFKVCFFYWMKTNIIPLMKKSSVRCHFMPYKARWQSSCCPSLWMHKHPGGHRVPQSRVFPVSTPQIWHTYDIQIAFLCGCWVLGCTTCEKGPGTPYGNPHTWEGVQLKGKCQTLNPDYPVTI